MDLLFQAPPDADPEPASLKPRRQARQTWQVHQLVAEARDLVEAEFGDVWVEGEISNLRPAASGHLYFTLKDAEAQLPVVLFRRQAILLRFRPEDGLQVRVRGKVSIYEQRGQLQLVAETMEPVGAGSLQLAFEQLRDRLKAEGLFDHQRKRPLPAYPRSVAIVTSPTGAVIRDFLNIVNRRHSGLNVILIPAAVQGDRAAVEVESAIANANLLGLGGHADLIVLARGGGSLEDLAAFNSERVARAIAASELPVVSAIGHETDFTIADFAADLRAATPSAAAELITEAQHKVEAEVAALGSRLVRASRFQLLQARQRFGRTPIAYAQQRLATQLHRLEQRLDDLSFRLETAITGRIRQHLRGVSHLAATVLRHDPRRQLSAARESLIARHSHLTHTLERSLAAARAQSQSAEGRLHRAAQASIAARRSAFTELRRELAALSPLAVLHRGYAIVQDDKGKIVRSIEQLTTNQQLATRLSDGTFTSQILALQAKNTPKKDKSPSP